MTQADEPSRGRAPVPTPPTRRGLLRVLAVVGVILALGLGLRAINLLPNFGNLFADRETDRSQPALLQSVRDLSRYVAADGTFQVVVDLQETKENIPEFLVNQRTLFVAYGSVQAFVDFSTLTEGAIVADPKVGTARITLPAPQLSQTALDLERSYVVSEERGLLNRIGDAFRTEPNKQQRVYQDAQKRITEDARSSDLDRRARENTKKMLESLLEGLGYSSVTVTYSTP